ncbi:MAG TPA: Ig-like domain repeat protein, partial [Candidatus Acidoferrales bacterium]|nr:Ig-like domain repeat protein [Candidatus Acidoferrales bacterium]
MNWSPLTQGMIAPKARASRPYCTAWAILLLALVVCEKLPGAPAGQQTPLAKQGAAAQGVQPRITQAVDESQLTSLPGNTHPLARREFDGGAVPPSQPMERMLLVLQRSAEQEAALKELLEEQQDKSSPNYHNWLTPEQFGRQFGPADQDIQTITSWLELHGFRVARIAKGRTVIEFSGTAAHVEETFRTAIHKYVVNGKEYWANAENPQIPTALAPAVHGVLSLHNFRKQPMVHSVGAFSRSQATGEVKPLLTGGSGANQFFALGPTDFATIYNVLGLWNATPTPIDGTGQSIAVVARSNINLQDVRDFRNVFGLPPNDPVVVLDGPDPGVVAGDEGEAILDVEWPGAVAKKAKIFLVISESANSTGTDGVDLSSLYIVDNNLAPVLSASFGACEASLGNAGNRFYSLLWAQAAAQGITALLPSGDNGSASCDGATGQTAATRGLAVNGLASTPFNVAVGGTDFDDAGNQSQFWNATNDPTTRASAKSYIPETTWNDSCAQNGLAGCTSVTPGTKDLLAAGGGPSTCATSTGARVCTAGYAKPSWQTGTGVPADGLRDQPDISLFSAVRSASGSFYVVCQADALSPTGPPSCNPSSGSFSFLGVGGTSASVQAFAGIMALVNQKTGTRQGNANFVLYKLAAKGGASCDSSAAGTVTNSACIFYDVTKAGSNISVACAGGSPNCSSASSGGFGVLVDPSHTSTPAWTATGGYDLATGLGSVNATNLANNWSSVSFTPSTTTLTLNGGNPVNSTHGQSVNVSITVAPQSGGGTPTGNVSLIGGPSGALGIDAFTLGSGGTASATTNLLPGGSYQVTAHYGGDGTFGASDSAGVSVTVNKENSQTFVSLVTFDFAGNVTSSNATTAPYGSPYVLRVDVRNAAGQLCSTNGACPAGQVTLTDNNSPLNDFNGSNAATLNSLGFLEDQPIQLPAASHSLAAAYAGDNSFNPSTASPDNVTITPTATANTVSANPSTAQPGASVTLTALVSTQSSGVAPTGTVQFLNGSTPIGGTVTLTGTAGSSTTFAALRATLTTSFAATASITASYSGDSNYSASTSSAITVTVTSTADFSLSSQPANNTVTAGGSATYAISASPVNGFNSPVALSCSVQSPAPTSFPPACGLNPTSITPGGSSSTLTVSTTMRSFVPPAEIGRWRSPLLVPVGLALLLAAWTCFAWTRRQRTLAGATLGALVLFLLLGIAGCGG